VERQLKIYKTALVSSSRDFIKRALEKEIARIYYKEAGAYASGIKYDAEIAKAIELLNQASVYKKILGWKQAD
jgi:hypothetical protein